MSRHEAWTCLRAYDHVVGRWTASALCFAIGLVVVFSAGCDWATRALSTSPPASSAQALRTCVDRWNQDNMVGWRHALISIAVRRLLPNEQDHVGVYGRARQCT